LVFAAFAGHDSFECLPYFTVKENTYIALVKTQRLQTSSLLTQHLLRVTTYCNLAEVM
jgi:hypothetical protein